MPKPPPEAPSRRHERWSDQEERVVQNYYTSQSMRRRWTNEEDVQLRRLYATHTYRQIGEQLERTTNAVMLRAQFLGIADRAAAPYSANDDAVLRALFDKTTFAQIAKRLGRSRQSVVGRSQKLGLKRKR